MEKFFAFWVIAATLCFAPEAVALSFLTVVEDGSVEARAVFAADKRVSSLPAERKQQIRGYYSFCLEYTYSESENSYKSYFVEPARGLTSFGRLGWLFSADLHDCKDCRENLLQ